MHSSIQSAIKDYEEELLRADWSKWNILSVLNKVPDEEERIESAIEIYWAERQLFKVVDLAEAVGFDKKEFLQLAKESSSHSVVVTCSYCETRYEREASSRSDWLSGRRSFVCEECKAKRENSWRECHEERQAEFQLLISLPYSEYLQTEHWQGLRKQKLRQAGYRCQLCNASKPLQVHHRTYERKGREDLRDLIVLCADCHQNFHEVAELDG